MHPPFQTPLENFITSRRRSQFLRKFMYHAAVVALAILTLVSIGFVVFVVWLAFT